MLNLDAIRNQNSKDDDKKWSYGMLDHLDQEKLMHYLI